MTDQVPAVLIAEDEPLASMALRAQVEALGYSVAGIARDGGEAVALGRCLPLDLAVFDMKMPGRTGLDAAIDLFADAPTPVVLLTGFGAADLPAPIPEPPIFAVLTKPIGLVELRGGMQRARDAFREWAEQEDRARHVDDARQDRRTIAHALGYSGDEMPRAESAVRLLERAREENLSPIEAARRILDAGG